MVLHASLLNTQHYKVWIKGKVDQSWERRSTPFHLSVVAIEKGAFWSPSTKGRQLYLYKVTTVYLYFSILSPVAIGLSVVVVMYL